MAINYVKYPYKNQETPLPDVVVIAKDRTGLPIVPYGTPFVGKLKVAAARARESELMNAALSSLLRDILDEYQAREAASTRAPAQDKKWWQFF